MNMTNKMIDHSGHNMHNMNKNNSVSNTMPGHGMPMHFNLASPFYLFLECCFISSPTSIVLASISLFLATIGYEGLKAFREHLMYSQNKRRHKYSKSHQNSPALLCADLNSAPINAEGDTVVIQSSDKSNLKTFLCERLRRDHLLQSFLHMLQTLVSYLLMLAFMTFNVWLCLAILLGSGVGYFLFGCRKSFILDNLDHCT